jgi:transposase
MRSSIWLHTTCRPSRRSAQRAADRRSPTDTFSKSCGQIIPLVLDFPKVEGKPGRPKEMPDELYADRGYDSDDTRWLLRWLGVEPFIGKRKTPHGSGLGKVRWVAERTIRWLKGLRRLRIRYDRLAVIPDAWNTLAGCVICFRLLHDDDTLLG